MGVVLAVRGRGLFCIERHRLHSRGHGRRMGGTGTQRVTETRMGDEGGVTGLLLGEKRQDRDLKDTGQDCQVLSRNTDQTLFPPIDLLLCSPNRGAQLFLRPLPLLSKFAYALSN